MTDPRGEVTELLAELKLGRKDTLDRLLPLVYQELRRIAGDQMRGERVGPHHAAHSPSTRGISMPGAPEPGQLAEPRPIFRRIRPVDAPLTGGSRAAARRRQVRIPVTLNEEIFPERPSADQNEEIHGCVHVRHGRAAERTNAPNSAEAEYSIQEPPFSEVCMLKAGERSRAKHLFSGRSERQESPSGTWVCATLSIRRYDQGPPIRR
jgi:hypothetical protein